MPHSGSSVFFLGGITYFGICLLPIALVQHANSFELVEHGILAGKMNVAIRFFCLLNRVQLLHQGRRQPLMCRDLSR